MRKPWKPATAALLRERARWPWGSWPTPDKGPQQETPPQPDPKPSAERTRPDTQPGADRTPNRAGDSDTRTAEKRAEAHDLALTLQCADLYHFTTTAGPWPD